MVLFKWTICLEQTDTGDVYRTHYSVITLRKCRKVCSHLNRTRTRGEVEVGFRYVGIHKANLHTTLPGVMYSREEGLIPA